MNNHKLKPFVDFLMLVSLVLTMISGRSKNHKTYAWILCILVAIHLILNWKLIVHWIADLFRK